MFENVPRGSRWWDHFSFQWELVTWFSLEDLKVLVSMYTGLLVYHSKIRHISWNVFLIYFRSLGFFCKMYGILHFLLTYLLFNTMKTGSVSREFTWKGVQKQRSGWRQQQSLLLPEQRGTGDAVGAAWNSLLQPLNLLSCKCPWGDVPQHRQHCWKQCQSPPLMYLEEQGMFIHSVCEYDPCE